MFTWNIVSVPHEPGVGLLVSVVLGAHDGGDCRLVANHGIDTGTNLRPGPITWALLRTWGEIWARVEHICEDVIVATARSAKHNTTSLEVTIGVVV